MVKRHSQYVISYKGLGDGLHLFDFKVDDSFFDEFENREIEKGNVDVQVSLNKKPNIFEFLFDLKGSVTVNCDRCLDPLEIEIEYKAPLFIKFGEATHEETDELLVLSEQETEIDVAQFIFEYINLSLPFRRVHPDKKGKSTCNKEMLKRLEELSVNEDKSEVDPRWNDLKNLLNDN